MGKIIRIRTIIPMVAGPELTGQEDLDRIAAAASEGTEIELRFIRTGPLKIDSEWEDALAIRPTVEEAITAESEGADAVVINCTSDTGLAACRECVRIPVVAPTMAAMHLAAQLSHRFSVLSFLEKVNARFEDMAWRWGLAHKLASVRSVNVPVLKITDDKGKLVQDLYTEGLKCYREDGAHALIMGCTLFESVSASVGQRFQEGGVPMLLLDPYRIAVKQAEELVRMGISHSKVTYPTPSSLETLDITTQD
jgi:allantoin racemase